MAQYFPRKIVMNRAMTIKYNKEQQSFFFLSHDDVEVVLQAFGFVQFDDDNFWDSCETELPFSCEILLTSISGFLDSWFSNFL